MNLYFEKITSQLTSIFKIHVLARNVQNTNYYILTKIVAKMDIYLKLADYLKRVDVGIFNSFLYKNPSSPHKNLQNKIRGRRGSILWEPERSIITRHLKVTLFKEKRCDSRIWHPAKLTFRHKGPQLLSTCKNPRNIVPMTLNAKSTKEWISDQQRWHKD